MENLLDLATQMTGQTQSWVWTAFLVFLRVGAAMALLPAFGETVVPQRIRLMLGVAFTTIVLPAVAENPVAQVQLLQPAVEVAMGLILGMGVRMFILALQTTAAIVANAMSLAQLFGGTGPEPQPAIGNLLAMAAMALAVTLGLHVKLVSLFLLSYQMVPPGVFPDWTLITQWGVAQISQSFALSFQLAAPFVVAALLYNMALGVINRAMPQLMVTTVGAPVLTGGALVLMALLVPLILTVWHNALDGFLANPFRAAP